MKAKLRFKITILFIAVALLPILFGGLLILNRAQENQLHHIRIMQLDFIQRATEVIQNNINHQFDDFEQIPVSDLSSENKTVDFEEKRKKVLNQLLKINNALLEVSFVNNQGLQEVKLSKHQVISKEDLVNFNQDPRYPQMLNNPRQLFFSFDLSNRPVFTLSLKLYDQRRQFQGLLLAQIDPQLHKVVEKIKVGITGEAYIVSKEGLVVAHKNPRFTQQKQDFSQFCPVQNFIGGHVDSDSAECRYKNYAGIEALGAFLPILYTSSVEENTQSVTLLAAVTEWPTSEALQIVTTLQNLIVGILIAAAVLSVVAGILLSLQIVNPIEKLQQGAKLIGGGQLDYRIDIKSGDEIEDLGSSFNTMAENLRLEFQRQQQTTRLLLRRDIELREINEELEKEKQQIVAERNKLAIVLSGVTDAVIAVDLHRQILIFNKAAENLTGYSAYEVVGQEIEQVIKIYDENGQISPINYCPIQPVGLEGSTFAKKELKIMGKEEKESFANVWAGQIKEGQTANIGCILTLHDVTAEQQLEIMKLDFVSMAAHELRSPLTSIRGYLSVLIEEVQEKLTVEQKSFLNRINIATIQLVALVENLLNVSRIERGILTVNLEVSDWLDLVRQSVADFADRAKEKSLSLQFIEPIQPAPKVLADKLRIGEVLSNLLSNAINYTQAGGQITVSLAQKDQDVITHIKDTGQGIPQDAIPYLFTKFFRVSGSLERGSKGTGLGLYIAKSIIDLHHGKIWVNSEEGRGSTFSFSLPVVEDSIDKIAKLG